MDKVSRKFSKSSVSGKVLMTKWDVKNVERLTRADFYSDNFQPRAAFLIPPGITYPNERTMLKAMNDIQQGLKNGGDREWKILQWRKGSRVIRLEEPKHTVQGDSGEPLQVKSMGVQLQRKSSSMRQKSVNLEPKSSKTSVTTKKAARSIFTVQELCGEVKGKKLGPKHLENLEQYTHDQLQKILDANKRFFQINQGTQIPEIFNAKQTKDTLNSISSTLDSNRFKGKVSSTGENLKKNCVTDGYKNKDDRSIEGIKKDVPSDTSSDEKCSFDSYTENSESSSTEFNKIERPKYAPESETVVKSILSDLLGGGNESGKTLTNTPFGRGDKIGVPHEKKSLKSGVVMYEKTSEAGSTRKKDQAGSVKGSCYSSSRSCATSSIVSSHTVNQRRRNEEIDRENYRLSARLEAIKTQAARNSITFRTKRHEQLPFARIQRRISKNSVSD